MPNGYARYERMPVDPRIVEDIQRSSSLSSEQGIGFMAEWGGSSQYKTFANLPRNNRYVYAAVLDGYSTPEEIEVVTGLSLKDVNMSLAELQGKGLVSSA
jgi:predicted Rossmann fold nucleotide-binding protein DprA/Smf involved in DNA uptake